MKRIFHLGGSVVTGDDLADAVMHYAEALSFRPQVDVVDIPIIDDTGLIGRGQILVGGAGQLVCVTAETVHAELLEPETVDTLRHKELVGMASGRASWTGEGLDAPQFDEFDY